MFLVSTRVVSIVTPTSVQLNIRNTINYGLFYLRLRVWHKVKSEQYEISVRILTVVYYCYVNFFLKQLLRWHPATCANKILNFVYNSALSRIKQNTTYYCLFYLLQAIVLHIIISIQTPLILKSATLIFNLQNNDT